MKDDRTDEELVERARKGETDAFSFLVRRYQDRVLGIAYSVLRDPDEAADAAQDVFLSVYRKLGNFHGKSKFYTWLYRISINTAIDRRRAKQRRWAESLDKENETTGEDGFSRLQDGSPGPMEKAADAEMERRIHEAIEELSPKHRQVILLRDVQGLSYQEIADVVGCNVGTVMSRLHYAREQLKQSVRPFLTAEPTEYS